MEIEPIKTLPDWMAAKERMEDWLQGYKQGEKDAQDAMDADEEEEGE